MSSILVVEDTPIIREPMARLLRSEGYDVACACNGLEALDALEQAPVDLVLLDVMMPKMDGITFLERIRSSAAHYHTPVIAMTGVMDSGRLARLRELGVRAVVPKGGFTFDLLMNEIHTHAPEPVA
jgi:CheY-like chemotaxis protein